MLKIGVLGAGHLGKIHMKCWAGIAGTQLIGFFDPDPVVAAEVSEVLGIPCFADADNLIAAADLVDIVSTTTMHYELAIRCLDHGKPIFIEKPLAATIEQAEELVQRSEQEGIPMQVGHVERFNPAFLAVRDQALEPQFIEAHRLANFNPRGSDVAVVLDLMIHDLDIILELVQSEVADVRASGVSVISDTEDICNARIEFVNGCIANVTASRISFKKMRKMRLFQKNAYISLDFLDKEAQVIRLHEDALLDEEAKARYVALDTSSGKKWVDISMAEVKENNAIQSELASFARSVVQGGPVAVPARDGLRALRLADQVLNAMKQQVLNV